jgi:hypothetical protein
MKNKLILRLSALVFAAIAVLGTVSAVTTQGSSADPLVTLSYLTNVLTPQLLGQVDQVVAQNQQSLVDQLNAVVKQSNSSSSGTQDTFSVVSLSAGQALTPAIGCEIMLRVGSATCVTSASPGLIDSTAGSTLNNGEALVTNHLYLTTVAGRSVHATNSVKLMVSGSYSIT